MDSIGAVATANVANMAADEDSDLDVTDNLVESFGGDFGGQESTSRSQSSSRSRDAIRRNGNHQPRPGNQVRYVRGTRGSLEMEANRMGTNNAMNIAERMANVTATVNTQPESIADAMANYVITRDEWLRCDESHARGPTFFNNICQHYENAYSLPNERTD